MSFFDGSSSSRPSKFLGLDNYVNLLKDENFRLAFFNTTIFAVATTSSRSLLALAPRGAPVAHGARPAGRRPSSCCTSRPVLVPFVPVTLGWREIFNYQHGDPERRPGRRSASPGSRG